MGHLGHDLYFLFFFLSLNERFVHENGTLKYQGQSGVVQGLGLLRYRNGEKIRVFGQNFENTNDEFSPNFDF